MRSEDGGLTWDFENPSTSESFQTVFFRDAYNGWIIGRGNVPENDQRRERLDAHGSSLP